MERMMNSSNITEGAGTARLEKSPVAVRDHLILFIIAFALAISRNLLLPESDLYWDWETEKHFRAASSLRTLIQAFPGYSAGYVSQGFAWHLFLWSIEAIAVLDIPTLRLGQDLILLFEHVLVGILVYRFVGLGGACFTLLLTAGMPAELFWSRSIYFFPLATTVVLLLVGVLIETVQDDDKPLPAGEIKSCAAVTILIGLSSLIYFPDAPIGIGAALVLLVASLLRRRIDFAIWSFIALIAWLSTPRLVFNTLLGDDHHWSHAKLFSNGANTLMRAGEHTQGILNTAMVLAGKLIHNVWELIRSLFFQRPFNDPSVLFASAGLPPIIPLSLLLLLPFIILPLYRRFQSDLWLAIPISLSIVAAPLFAFDFHIRRFSCLLTFLYIGFGTGMALAINSLSSRRKRHLANVLMTTLALLLYTNELKYLRQGLLRTDNQIAQLAQQTELKSGTTVICADHDVALWSRTLIAVRAMKLPANTSRPYILAITPKQSASIKNMADLERHCAEWGVSCELEAPHSPFARSKVSLPPPVHWEGTCSPSPEFAPQIENITLLRNWKLRKG